MKLIKINTDHYVVVDDSEITQACYVYKNHENVHGRGIFYLPPDTDFVAFNKEAKDISVITHSTQPMPHGAVREGQITGVTAISLQKVKELIGEVDVEKKARKFLKSKEDFDDTTTNYWIDFLVEFYNQALEDNKDKKYTEAQMRECWRASERFDRPYNEGYAPNFEEFIQSLQPKTEWEVEWETIDNRQPCDCSCHNNPNMVHFVACCNDGWIGKVTQKLKLK